MAFRRRKYIVDGKVQGAVLWRLFVYWLYCLLAMTTMMCGWVVLTSTPQSSSELFLQVWWQIGPAMIATTFLLPFLLYDCAKLSNRFAGPMFRMRSAFQQLADGQRIEPLNVRDDDFWRDVVADFNRAVDRLQGEKPTE